MPKGEKKAGGRPKTVKQYSEQTKKNWLAAAKKIAQETGMKVEEHLLRMIIGYKCPLCAGTGIGKNKEDLDILCIGCKGAGKIVPTQDTAIVGIGKLYNDALLIKESEQTINDKRSGPTIGLPPIMTRPEKREEEEIRERLHG